MNQLTFREAIERTPDVANGFRGGLAHGRRLDGGLGSKSGGLAHGRRLFERYGLHYMLLGVWQAKNVSAEK